MGVWNVNRLRKLGVPQYTTTQGGETCCCGSTARVHGQAREVVEALGEPRSLRGAVLTLGRQGARVRSSQAWVARA